MTPLPATAKGRRLYPERIANRKNDVEVEIGCPWKAAGLQVTINTGLIGTRAQDAGIAVPVSITNTTKSVRNGFLNLALQTPAGPTLFPAIGGVGLGVFNPGALFFRPGETKIGQMDFIFPSQPMRGRYYLIWAPTGPIVSSGLSANDVSTNSVVIEIHH